MPRTTSSAEFIVVIEGPAVSQRYVGVVIVKDGKILATGYRGESGSGDHGEYCALKKLNGADVQVRLSIQR